MSSIYIFVDNSNLWIEGKKVSGRYQKPALPSNRLYRIEYGRLLNFVRDSRELGSIPMLYGSEPPPNDSVWKMIESKGFDVRVFRRNIFNKEKGVDMKMGIDITKLVLTTQSPSTVAIVAGDADFKPVVEQVHELGWKAECWYWSNVAGDLRGVVDRFEELDPVAYKIGFDGR